MNRRNNLSKLLIGIAIIFAITFTAFADTIRLKNGSLIKGRIVGFSGGKFTIAVGEGARKREFSFRADEVESIDFDAKETRASSPSVRTTAGDDVIINTPRTSSANVSKPKVVTTESINTQPRSTPDPSAQPRQPVTRRTSAVSPGKPVELNVRVVADNTANGWTNSGWVVKKGQKIRISGGGEVSLGGGRTSSPAGLYEIEDKGKLLPNVPTGALIAVIGDDNNEFIYVGMEREFVAARDGTLFLGVNEGNLNDNSGAFDVKVEISTDKGA